MATIMVRDRGLGALGSRCSGVEAAGLGGIGQSLEGFIRPKAEAIIRIGSSSSVEPEFSGLPCNDT